MKIAFNVTYRTRWGEQLVLRWGDRTIAMEWSEGDCWRCEAETGADAAACEYAYEVRCDGCTVRCEEGSHRLPRVGASGTVRVFDRWIERDDDAPLLTTAFTRGIFGRGSAAAPAAQDAGAGEAVATECAQIAAAGGGRFGAGRAVLRVVFPDVRPDEVLAVAGDGPGMEAWRRAVAMDDSRFPEWSLELPACGPFAWKFVVADRATGAVRRWEEGPDRRWELLPAADERVVEASLRPRLEQSRWRGAGTAVPLFSLRSERSFGVGEFADLKLLVDWAVATGQRIIQLLPVNDTTMTGGWEDSYPYNATSSFALHPQFIRLTEAGVEEDAAYRRLRDELDALPALDYVRVNEAKQRLLRRAFERCGAETLASPGYRAFCEANRAWLVPYAAFCTLRDRFGTADFATWGPYARYDAATVEAFCRENRASTDFHCYVQYHLHLQFSEACRYARSRGVVLKGDLPIGVSRTSCDAWCAPALFRLDSQAGAPPDAFAAEGQNWGFPTYDWERMASDGYAWWRARLGKMAHYFDAFRIDHILGFFRIWEIPAEAIHGLTGHFNPALPLSAAELRAEGFDMAGGRYTTPPTDEETLRLFFGDWSDEVRRECLDGGKLRPEVATQRRAAALFADADERSTRLREGFLALLDDVLFVEDPRREGYYHPRIGGQATRSYAALDAAHRAAFDRLHDDFFYRRHDRFWQESAERKLPALLAATGMLACGEDLGMIPACVPETMRRLRILSLEIQRMPKGPGERFADPARYPYLSVCTTSTHDMNPLRAWWEEDRGQTRAFWHEVLRGEGEPPQECTAEVCRRIVAMHLSSPAMLAILPLQDWLSVDGALRAADPAAERINIPAVARHYWRYRMHLRLEELLAADGFNARLREAIAASGRS